MSTPKRPLARRRLLGVGLALATALPGCGLRPLYGRPKAGNADISAELAGIDIRTARGRLPQQLRNSLEDLFNPAGRSVVKAHELRVDIEEYDNALAIQLDDTITRYDLYLLASFSLHDLGVDRPLYTASVRRLASYDVAREPYATLVAKQDAQRRVVAEVGRDIRTRLALYFADRA